MSTMFGSKIKECREALGLTQEELAKKMGYKSKSTINKIEMGINDVTQSKILSFAKALQVPPSHLMGWEENKLSNLVKRKEFDLNILFEENDNAKYLLRFLSYIFKKERIENDLTEKSIAQQANILLEDYINIEASKSTDINNIEKVIKAYSLNFYYIYGLMVAINSVLASVNTRHLKVEEIEKSKNEIVDNMIENFVTMVKSTSND